MSEHDVKAPHEHSQHHSEHHQHRVRHSTRQRGSGLIFGLILLTAGALFLLDNLGILEVRSFFEWWPLVLIAIGLAELVGGNRLGSMIWIAFGGWFLAYNFDVLTVNPFEVFWPVIFILVGSIFVWQSLQQKPPREGANRMSAFAFMAGNVQRGFAGVVDRIQAAAVMGGCEIDLSMIRRGEQPTVIDCFAMWGGIEISIPEGWALDIRITPVLAGIEDKTAPPAPEAPLVILTGTVVMGGIEVRN